MSTTPPLSHPISEETHMGSSLEPEVDVGKISSEEIDDLAFEEETHVDVDEVDSEEINVSTFEEDVPPEESSSVTTTSSHHQVSNESGEWSDLETEEGLWDGEDTALDSGEITQPTVKDITSSPTSSTESGAGEIPPNTMVRIIISSKVLA